MISVVVDAGNTRIKCAVFNGNSLVETHAVVTKQAPATLHRLIAKHAPSHSILSNVAGTLAAVTQTLNAKTKLLQLTHRTPLPFNVTYRSRTVGTDRLALAAVAQDVLKNRNALVVSAGTCITYDFVDRSGDYRGGAISPGLQMRLNALHTQTARLPTVKLNGVAPMIGHSTETAIRSGVLHGAAHEINGFVADYKRHYKDLRIVLTGGDAPRLEPHLNFRIFARPHAVLEGLQRILQHNIGAR